MEISRYTCNDCGCVFEYRILNRGTSEEEKKESKKEYKGQRRITCPECESYNITTA